MHRMGGSVLFGMSLTPRRPVVMVVDDDADVLENAKGWLVGEGFDVVDAPSGVAAIGLLRASLPSVVVLDLLMPGVTGWDVWDWLQQHHPALPVLVWTASGLRTGAVGSAPVISKNQPQALLAALQTMIGHAAVPA